MCNCRDTLIPMIGVITDIVEETAVDNAEEPAEDIGEGGMEEVEEIFDDEPAVSEQAHSSVLPIVISAAAAAVAVIAAIVIIMVKRKK